MSKPWLNLGRIGHGILIGTEDHAIAVFYGPNTNPTSESDISMMLEAVNKQMRKPFTSCKCGHDLLNHEPGPGNIYRSCMMQGCRCDIYRPSHT